MKVVVTGALGHIGSRLIRELPATFPEAQIVMIDNMSAQRYCSLFDLPAEGNYSFVEGNVLEYDLEKLTDGADVSIHLAAITDAAGSFEIRKKVEYENFNASKRVAEACLKTGTALIHLSSTKWTKPVLRVISNRKVLTLKRSCVKKTFLFRLEAQAD
jgi:UDP-glucose 4-epimerase